MNLVCCNCDKIFSSKSSLWGHSRHCKKRSNEEQYVHIYETNKKESNEEIIFDENIIVDNYQEDIESSLENKVFTKYYKFQKNFLRNYDFNNAYHVKLSNGSYEIGDKYIYLILLKYVVNTHGLSDNAADELIKCIKLMSKLNGKEIALPSKFERILKILLDPIRY